jgi:ABC-type multidrug transport system fused ATPase/permease subunit
MSKKANVVDQEKVAEKGAEVSTFTKLRYSHKFRLWFIGILLVIVAVLFVFFEKLRILLIVAFITLLAAFGLEATHNDWDVGKLIKTRSFQESKVSRDTGGNILFDKLGNITTDSSKGKKADEYNCDDFSTQPEAQAFFIKVGGTKHDVNRLDGNKDGEACESLPKGDKNK